jgi:hypothetical protein
MDSSTIFEVRPDARLAESVSPGRARAFLVLSALTSLAILLQGVTAGQFLGREAEGWVTTHGVIADVSWVLALVTAIFGARAIRAVAQRLVIWAGVLFVVTLAQTGVGHLMTDYHKNLVALHVPLAMVVLGLTIWVTVRAARLDRAVHMAAAPR